MENNEESIDLGRLASIAWAHKKTVGGIIGACTVIALATSFAMPEKYSSTALVQMRGVNVDVSGMKAAAAAMGFSTGSNSGSVQSYIELMKSRAVLTPIIDELYAGKDEDKRPGAAGFAKDNLKIENTKQTNLISITGKGKTPDEAQYITQSVVDNFLQLQTNMNGETQSILLKFLNDRIATAKQEADEAAQAFADYQKEHKIYSPTDQAKAVVEQGQAWDKAISEMQVQQQAAQAQLGAVQSQIGDQENRSDAYQINDNTNVQDLRGQIVKKQVELVGLRQKYTDNHPSVRSAEQELAQLQQSLTREVDAVVQSHTATMNPTHAKLVQQQVEGEVNLATAKASEAALRHNRDEKDNELGSFPQEVKDYLDLERDAKIKQEIYTNLVNQSEQARIKQAMQSMDVQVVDPADLPKHPSEPRRNLITAIGFAVGCLLAFGYSLIAYKRESY